MFLQSSLRGVRSAGFTAFVVFMLVVFAGTVSADTDSSDYSSNDSDDPMSPVHAAIEKEDFEAAITELQNLIENEGETADALNLLGFSNRKLKQYDAAYDFYTRALAMEPQHLGANEYLGELFVETDKMDQAKAQLEIIYKICEAYCREYMKLKKMIESNI